MIRSQRVLRTLDKSQVHVADPMDPLWYEFPYVTAH